MKPYLAIFLKFLHFGFLAWGGPVAQIGMLRDELVTKEQWITADKFKRVLAVYQVLPGPEAHEMCVYLGMVRGGRLGGLVAGLGFMMPGFLLMLLLAFAYKSFGSATLLAFFVGVKPAVSALIIRAVHRIGSHVFHGITLWVAGAVSVLLTVLGFHFFLVFTLCGIWQAIWEKGYKKAAIAFLAVSISLCIAWFAFTQTTSVPNQAESSTLSEQSFFVEGLKAGLLSFGGAYTVIPFLKDGMVNKQPGITEGVFLDGIALSGVIPAPLVIFATFLGFMGGGIIGALAITAGIFLPAFAFTLLGHRHIEKAIEHKPLHGFLDGMAAGVVGLLAVTSIQILLSSVNTIPEIAIFVVALALLYLFKTKWIIPAVVVVSAIAGILL